MKNTDKDLTKRFTNTYIFYDKDINKLMLLLWEGIYPYEYMDSWKRFNETLLPGLKYFCNKLKMKSNTDTDYQDAKNVS